MISFSFTRISILRCAAALSTVALLPATAAHAQSEVINEARTYLYYRIPDAKAQNLLPTAWRVAPLAAGAAKGANLIVILMERYLATDSTGKPLAQGSNRQAVLVVPATNDQAVITALMVIGGYTADPAGAPGAYKVYQPASVTLERSARAGNATPPTAQEEWHVATATERLDVELAYTPAVPTPVKFDQRAYSSAVPTFYRMYRGDQGVDVLRSTVTGMDRVTSVHIKATGGRLGTLLDGTAELINITRMPWYHRQTFLP